MRQKQQTTKRAREVNFQGWYDPEDPYESGVIDAFNHFQTKYSLKPKEVIAQAVLRMAQNDGDYESPVVQPAHDLSDSRYEQLTGLLSRLIAGIENGSFVPVNEAARQTFQEDAETFDTISRSVAGRYRPISFEDED